jgi:hypothetical protein
MDCVIV